MKRGILTLKPINRIFVAEKPILALKNHFGAEKILYETGPRGSVSTIFYFSWEIITTMADLAVYFDLIFFPFYSFFYGDLPTILHKTKEKKTSLWLYAWLTFFSFIFTTATALSYSRVIAFLPAAVCQMSLMVPSTRYWRQMTWCPADHISSSVSEKKIYL